VIHIFEPLRIQSPPSRSVVRRTGRSGIESVTTIRSNGDAARFS
jgi:hypothetical protein